MEYKKPESQYNMLDWWKKVVIENYANFEGRARRSEYWFFALMNVIIYFTVVFLSMFLTGSLGAISDSLAGIGMLPMLLIILFGVAMIIPTLEVQVRRLHDSGKSGWFILLGFVPVVSIVLLVFFFLDSDVGPNEYGPNPKGIGND